MRGRGHGERRIRCWIRWGHYGRVEWIQENVVVPEILVPAKRRLQVVPLVFVDPQARDDIRVAAIAEVAEVQAIEQISMVVERPHTQRVVQQSGPGIEVYESSVVALIPVDPRRPVAYLQILLRIVVAGIDTLGFRFKVLLCAGQRGEEKPSGCYQQSERSYFRTTIHGCSPLPQMDYPLRQIVIVLTASSAPQSPIQQAAEVRSVNFHVAIDARLFIVGLVRIHHRGVNAGRIRVALQTN